MEGKLIDEPLLLAAIEINPGHPEANLFMREVRRGAAMIRPRSRCLLARTSSRRTTQR